MQVAEPDGLDKRLLYYASKEYSQQIESGEFYTNDKWIYFIKEAENLEVIPENVDDEGLKAAYQDANRHSWSKEELVAYDYAAMRDQDERGKTELAVKRAEKRGEERGENKGKIEVAKKLKEMDMSNEDIRNATGLSDEEIENL